MQAVYFEKFGAPDVLKFGEMPEPTCGSSQVVVEVKAASINPVDYKIVEGEGLPLPLFGKFPRIPGSDFAGVVLKTGSAVTHVKPGDEVYGISTSFFGGPGSHAQKVVTNKRVVRKIPAGLTIETMSAIPVGALTALNGLRQCGELKGKNILLTGASGGVGLFALQLAKHFGAHVTTICSAKNVPLVRRLGADETRDYATTPLESLNRKFDVFFDAYGPTPLATAAPLIERGGYYVTTLPRGSKIFKSFFGFIFSNPHVVMANLSISKSGFETIEKLLVEKKLEVLISKKYPLSAAAEAYAALKSGGIPGKIILTA
jgi:NADPH:quinone reductase-like Zn-dependent oxidoreductase